MLDKLEVRVPAAAPFRPDFKALCSDLMADQKGPFRRRGNHYLQTGDLRSYGYDAILHLHCVHGGSGKVEAMNVKGDTRVDHGGNHKVEFVDTGKRGLSFMMGELEKMFEVDPLKCELMRVDCAADVPGIGVSWFLKHLRIKGKRFANQMGEVLAPALPKGGVREGSIFYSMMGKGFVQTVYIGKRPNVFRCYDKVEELRVEYGRFVARSGAALLARMQKAGATPEEIEWRLSEEGFNPDAEDYSLPSFEQMYGMPQWGFILTRCERQIGGGAVPTIPVPFKPARDWERLETVGHLKKRGLDYNPYRECELIRPGMYEPAAEDYELTTYMSGMYLRERIYQDGIQQVKSWLNRHRRRGATRPGSRAKKYLERLADFIPEPDEPEHGGLTSVEELYERYRYSLSKQLAA